jgi:hypothetical protein
VTIHERHQPLELVSPKGRCMCTVIVDYGYGSDILYECIHRGTGEIWWYRPKDVRVINCVTWDIGQRATALTPADLAPAAAPGSPPEAPGAAAPGSRAAPPAASQPPSQPSPRVVQPPPAPPPPGPPAAPPSGPFVMSPETPLASLPRAGLTARRGLSPFKVEVGE